MDRQPHRPHRVHPFFRDGVRQRPVSRISSLRAITDVSQLAGLDDPVLLRRARHVVTDNQRVLQVAALLRSSGGGDAHGLREVGALLTQSHVSLRDDFEVSWPEADVAVEVAVAAGGWGPG